MDIQQKLIEYIKKNRVSSTEVADCLGKRGAIPNIKALNRGHFEVGNVFWAYAYGGSNWDLHEQLQHVKENDIVLVEVFDSDNKAVFGDLVSKYLILYRQVSAIVVVGNLRDVPRLMKENWPIWCEGFNPIGCENVQLESKLDEKIIIERRNQYDGAIAVCDDTGVVLIPQSFHNEEFYRRLEFIESQEDIWYECIDRKKMTTFEAVCLKKYEQK
ncbi:RraA family protein [Phosphitispora fastidiosa]|uniref:RraA family protein n=1 Tax=Phosphitispora fastidiosa TaxID=2837202 RepID=UPI001E524969|nr:RraA family protein [Phosphitispora fastidiosa]MBU7006395.1 regulator of RNase E activity RraA [Phosphitispora fastidiosa]